DEHGVKTFRGSAVFYNPRIDQSDHYAGTISGWKTKYALISRVKVEPYGMEEEDLEGYRLIEIGAKVGALIEEEGTIHGAGVNKIYQFTLYAQPDKIFELTVSADLESSIADEAFLPQSIGLLRPGTSLINLYPNYDNDVVSFNRVEIYPAKVINIHSPNLVSKTNMCDVVDCVEYWDEDDTSHDVIKPPRSIPVMCAGEWANNIIVDDLQVIKFMEYIREPWGDGRDGGKLHVDDINYGESVPVFLYDLRIMGGATPWWIKTTPWSNSKSFGPHTVDLETGWPTHTDAAVIPYYAVIENDLSKGYLARGASYPVNIYSEKSGWMGEIIDQKVLAFSSVNVFEDGEDYMRLNGENTGFLLLDEGPMWVTSCQREPGPALSTQALYAPE
ncbi:MAG: hypothetical protein KAI64_06625, partial [Thermoplasmata archaeon]|nr:hypothetical protein [Thermoplasmata archaeon]